MCGFTLHACSRCYCNCSAKLEILRACTWMWLIKVTDFSEQSSASEKSKSQTTNEGHGLFLRSGLYEMLMWTFLCGPQDPGRRTVLWVRWATRCTRPTLLCSLRWFSYTWKWGDGQKVAAETRTVTCCAWMTWDTLPQTLPLIDVFLWFKTHETCILQYFADSSTILPLFITYYIIAFKCIAHSNRCWIIIRTSE